MIANCAVASASGGAFGFDRLRQEAQRRAAEPYRPAEANLPQAWRDLDYDGYRAISYRPDKALWRREDLPFRVEFYHPGYLFRQSVKVSVVDGDSETRIPFSPDLFDYAASPARGQEGTPNAKDRVGEPEPLHDVGFAGFRLLYRINGPIDHEEFISFLGATYFRAVGRHQVYGASARGLAIDMGSGDEEFPLFTDFWIEKPSAAARAITVYALLDSPSVAGAYRFDIHPGDETVVAVHAEIFARGQPTNVGIAPLTSMYFYGPNGPQRLRGERPQVHDSDGLLIAEEAGTWTWRPLWNPHAVSRSELQVKSIRGFGLMQRDRDPNHYRDPRTSYERRPSIWVEVSEPQSPASSNPWGQGVVQLLELPGAGEGQDNIGACWAPAASLEPGRTLPIDYRLHFGPGPPEGHDVGKATATRWWVPTRDASEVGDPCELPQGQTHFEVDFDLPTPLAERASSLRVPSDNGGEREQNVLAAWTPEASLSATHGQVGPARVYQGPFGNSWCVAFDFEPEDRRTAELQVYLQAGGLPLTEIWSFAWPR